MEYFNAEPSGSERKYIIVAKLDTILLEHLSHATNSQISIKFGKENVLNIDGQSFTFGSTPEDLIQECYQQEGATWMCMGDIKRKAMFQHQLTSEDRERVREKSDNAEKARKERHIAKFIDGPLVKPGRERKTTNDKQTPKKTRPARTAVIPMNPKPSLPLASSTPVSQPIPPPGSGSNEKSKPSKPSPTTLSSNSSTTSTSPTANLGLQGEKRAPLASSVSATIPSSHATINGHSMDSTPLVPRTKSIGREPDPSPEKKSPPLSVQPPLSQTTSIHTVSNNIIPPPITTIQPTSFDIEAVSQPPPKEKENTKPALTGKELRKHIIQTLAVGPLPPVRLQNLYPNLDHNILNQVATFANNGNMWHLRKMCWKEVDLDWKDYTELERKKAQRNHQKEIAKTQPPPQPTPTPAAPVQPTPVQPTPTNPPAATLNHSNNNNNPEPKPVNGVIPHAEPSGAKVIVKVKNPFKKLRQQNADKRKAEELTSDKTKQQKTEVVPPKPIETYVEFVQRKSEYETKYDEYVKLRSEIGNVQKVFLDLGAKQKDASASEKENVEKEIKQLYAEKSEKFQVMWRRHQVLHEELSMLKSLLREAQPKFSQENGKL